MAIASGAPWTGISDGTSPDVTALVNSTLVHALDFDDVLPGAGHPSGPVLSAILATASVPGVSLCGRGLLEAYVVGIEVMRALARAVGPRHYQRGWHTTSTIGGFAAAAAAAKVLGLDKTAVARALGLAATMACGLQRNFGTATKPLHSGFAAANGVTAALLARTGFTAAEDVLDGPRGFLDLYSDGGSRPEEIDRLGTSYALLTPGISLKKYACCFEVYRPIDAVLQLRGRLGLADGEVREIRCTVPPGTTGPLINRWPDDGMSAKFSLEYAIAAAFVDGVITIDNVRRRRPGPAGTARCPWRHPHRGGRPDPAGRPARTGEQCVVGRLRRGCRRPPRRHTRDGGGLRRSRYTRASAVGQRRRRKVPGVSGNGWAVRTGGDGPARPATQTGGRTGYRCAAAGPGAVSGRGARRTVRP